jgi:hypothetical protein
MTEILIIACTPTGPIFKTAYGRKIFALPVRYTLKDGSTQNGHLTAEKKKELPEDLDRKHAEIEAKALAASFDETGKFTGTSVTYDIIGGSAGMVPVPKEGL